MPDTKLSALPSGTAIVDADLFYSDQSATSVKQAATAIAAYAASKSIGSVFTGGTPGSVLFIGAGSVLAQDNANFFWDDANQNLKIGHSGGPVATYFTNGLPGLYTIPNVSGNNWFEGNAGNTTLTGFGNFGTGDGVLASLTTGSSNLAMGGFDTAGGGSGITAHAITTGHQNCAFGAGALSSLSTGNFNTAFGQSCLTNLSTESNSTSIGTFAGQNAGRGGGGAGLGAATFVGTSCFQSCIPVQGCVGMGFSTASAITSSGGFDTIIGTLGLSNATSSAGFNTLIGAEAAINFTGATACTVLGVWKGPALSLSNIIAVAGGNDNTVPALDCGYTNSTGWTWSFTTRHGSSDKPVGIQLYNTQDTLAPPTNYERLCLDWNLTSNIARLASQAGGTGTVRMIAIDGFQKAGAPAASDLPSGTWGVINDTSGGNTWLVYNNAGTIRKVQLV